MHPSLQYKEFMAETLTPRLVRRGCCFSLGSSSRASLRSTTPDLQHHPHQLKDWEKTTAPSQLRKSGLQPNEAQREAQIPPPHRTSQAMVSCPRPAAAPAPQQYHHHHLHWTHTSPGPAGALGTQQPSSSSSAHLVHSYSDSSTSYFEAGFFLEEASLSALSPKSLRVLALIPPPALIKAEG